jgi:glycerophosphoryl diester phosphodiesterase
MGSGMQTAPNEPLTVAALARSVWHDFLHARRALFVYEILFKLVEAWLLVPAAAVVLAAVLSRAGHVAVSNWDVLDFLLTPSGLLYAGLFSTVAVALLLFEQAGVMVLGALTGAGERPPFQQILRLAFQKALGIFQLSAVAAVLLALALIPFLLLAILTYRIFLSEHDVYFYLKDRPPVFWLAAGIGALLLLAALAVALLLYVRWAFALPLLLFENQFSRAALRASRERVRGTGWRVGFILLGWLVGVLLLGVVLEAGFRLVAAAVLDNAGDRPVALILLLLVAQGGLLATVSFVLVVGLGLLTRRLYLLRNEQLGLLRPDGWGTAPSMEKPALPWNWLLAWLSMLLFLLAPLVLWLDLSRYVRARPLVQVTAHRGHSRAAPENTLRAVHKAIESGADYAEIDVQRTADGVAVLLHDSDLKRVAGVSRRLEEMSYDELRKLDVGSWFGPAFASERAPTLKEVIKLSRGRIKLNIELKFFGPDRRLAQEVARLVREQDFELDCLVTSLNYDALLEVKRHNPRLRTGLIVAHALGDVSRLETEVLSVRADFLSDELLRSAHRRGMEIHVWTVNDASQMVRLMKRGVDNLLTSDPDVAIRMRNQWDRVTGTERLLLASRLLLGLGP